MSVDLIPEQSKYGAVTRTLPREQAAPSQKVKGPVEVTGHWAVMACIERHAEHPKHYYSVFGNTRAMCTVQCLTTVNNKWMAAAHTFCFGLFHKAKPRTIFLLFLTKLHQLFRLRGIT